MLFSQNEADLRANSGYYILSTYTDRFTKWSYAVWLSAQDMATTKKALKKCLDAIPGGKVPKRIYSDQGKEYASDFTTYVNGLGIVHKKTPAKTPLKFIERFNRSIRDAATKFRTTYDTKRIKDFVTTFVRRYNK